jgi:hypothetical protein
VSGRGEFVYSIRSLALASATVCHCILEGTSGPPLQRDDVIYDVTSRGAGCLTGEGTRPVASEGREAPPMIEDARPTMAQAAARQMLLRLLTAGSPILPHPLRNVLAFLGAHELPAATLDAVSGSGSSTGTSLQLLQRSDNPLKSLFLAA